MFCNLKWWYIIFNLNVVPYHQVDTVTICEIPNISNHVMPTKVISNFILQRRVFTWFPR
jgi:hypothetical protein